MSGTTLRAAARVFRAAILTGCIALISMGMAAQTPAMAAGKPARVAISQPDTTSFPEMQATVVVLDSKNVPVIGLGAEHFELLEDGVPVPISSVSQESTNQSGLASVLGLDISGSMDAQSFTQAKAALASFASRLSHADALGVVTFGGQCRTDRGPGISNVHGPALEFVTAARAGGQTPFRDATQAAVYMAASAPQGQGRQIVIMLTDGDDTCSTVNDSDVIGAATSRDIPVYIIGLGRDLRADVLERLAATTGGEYLAVDSADRLDEIYSRLIARLKSQYVVRYRSTRFADRNAHTLAARVKTELGEATDETRFTPPVFEPRVDVSVTPAQRIERPISVQISTGAPVRLTQAEVTLDDAPLEVPTRPPFTFTIGPTGLAGATRTLRVRVTDEAGGVSETTLPVELVPPSMVTSVSPNQRVDQPFQATVTTDPPVPLARASVTLDGVPLPPLPGDTLGATVAPSDFRGGIRTMRVVVTDPAGVEAEHSVPVEMGVPAIRASVDPYDRIVDPTVITLSTDPPIPLTRIAVMLDNIPLQQLSQEPWSFTFDPAGLSGSRTLRIVAVDQTGLEQERSIDIQVGATIFGLPYWSILAAILLLPVGVVVILFVLAQRGTWRCPNCRTRNRRASVACQRCHEVWAPSAQPAAPSVAVDAPSRPFTAGGALSGSQAAAGIGVVRAAHRRPGPASGWLVIDEGPMRGESFPLPPGESRIGRAVNSDVQIDDVSLAETQVVIRFLGGAHDLQRVGGPTSVLVNGRPVDDCRLRPGDRLTVGGTSFIFRLNAPARN